MKNQKLLPLLLTLTLSQSLYAGHGKEGGDAVVCANKVSLLDQFEGKQNGLITHIEGKTLREKAQSILKRIKQYDFFTYKNIQKETHLLLDDLEAYEQGKRDLNLISFSDKRLSDVQDAYEIDFSEEPEECYVRQLVLRGDRSEKADLNGEKPYTFQRQLWEKMDLDNKVMTIFHEAWYLYITNDGATDSRFARHMNAYMASSEGIQGSFMDYQEKFSQKIDLGAENVKQRVLIPVSDKEKRTGKNIYMARWVKLLTENVEKTQEEACYIIDDPSWRISSSKPYTIISNSEFEESEEISLRTKELIKQGYASVSKDYLDFRSYIDEQMIREPLEEFAAAGKNIAGYRLCMNEAGKITRITNTVRYDFSLPERMHIASGVLFNRVGHGLQTALQAPTLTPVTVMIGLPASMLFSKTRFYERTYLPNNQVKVNLKEPIKGRLVLQKKYFGSDKKRLRFTKSFTVDRLTGEIIDKQ